MTKAIGRKGVCTLSTRLESALLARYRERAHPCPACGGVALVLRQDTGWRWLVRRAVRLMGKLAPRRKRARWRATLYQRRST